MKTMEPVAWGKPNMIAWPVVGPLLQTSGFPNSGQTGLGRQKVIGQKKITAERPNDASPRMRFNICSTYHSILLAQPCGKQISDFFAAAYRERQIPPGRPGVSPLYLATGQHLQKQSLVDDFDIRPFGAKFRSP
jgi:hypothetical protein